MKEQYKTYLIAALYFISGFLTWLSAGYIFNGGTANLIEPTARFMMTVFHFSLGIGDTAFLLYTISDLIIVFFYILLLSIITGKRNIWNITYIIGAIGLPLYHTIRNHIVFYKHDLPVWGTLLASLAAYCIIPLLVWVGANLGNKYQIERQHNKSPHTDAE